MEEHVLELIKHQKMVGEEVLNKIKILDSSCLIAGGAPRDWFSGKPCQDIDIYYYYGLETLDTNGKKLENILGTDLVVLGKEYDPNSHKGKIRGVHETTYKGVKLNLIGWKSKTYDVIETYPASTSLFYAYNPATGKCAIPKTISSSHIYTNNIYVSKDISLKYYNKLRDKFPNHKLLMVNSLENLILKREVYAFFNYLRASDYVSNIGNPTDKELDAIAMMYPNLKITEDWHRVGEIVVDITNTPPDENKPDKYGSGKVDIPW